MDPIKKINFNTNNSSQINEVRQEELSFEDGNVFEIAEQTQIPTSCPNETPFVVLPPTIIEQPYHNPEEINNWGDILEYADIAESPEEVEKKVIDSMADKKDKPEDLKYLVDSMLEGISDHYDSGLSKDGIAGTNAEKLMSHIKGGGDVQGSICLTEHGLVSDMLNEAGIPAAVISGNWGKYGHATLLYQNSNGQFVWNNYGDSFELPENITNLQDAIKYITKESGTEDSKIGSQMDFTDAGLMGIYNQDGYFKKVLYDEEAAFGEKLDKTTTDKQSMLDKTKFENENSIAIEQNGKVTLTKSEFDKNKNSQLTISGKKQENGETTGFYDSESIGIDIDSVQKFQNDKTSLTLDNNITYSHIDNKDKYQINYLALDSSATNVKTILDKDDSNINLFGGAGIHAIGTRNANTSTIFSDADVRIYNEIGVQADKTTENDSISAQASVGMPLDFTLKEYKQSISGVTINPGFSIKTSTTLKHNINPNLTLSADGNFNYTQTKYLNHTNFGASLGVNYKDSQADLSANIGVNHDQEHLTFNLFEEDLKNETEIYTSLEYSPKENIELNGKISYDINSQEFTGSAGVKLKF